MKSYMILQRICLLASVACLGIPYLLAGNWLIILFFLAMAGFWIFMKKRSASWTASILLVIFVLLAAGGVLANSPTPLMIVACTAALAWWDLTNFGESLVADQPPETIVLLERDHLQSLALAVSAGLILAIGSSYLDLQVPFIGTVFLGLLATGCFLYGLQPLVKKKY